MTIDDGRGWSKTTTYAYADALYDSNERRWLGFGYSKTTEPPLPGETAGPYTETWFRQEIATVGAVDKAESRDGDGNLLSSMDNLFTIGGDGETEPWTAQITGRYSYLWDGSGTACGSWPCTYGERRYQEFDYDGYGNSTQTRDYGNLDASGDEVTSVSEFYPDTSGYITNKTARAVTYFGIGTSGAKLTDALVFYDGALSYNLAPTQGPVTNHSVWLDTEDRYISGCASGVCIEYDVYGNVDKTTDLKGGQTTIIYDTTYNLFPTSVTNALSHATTTTWDALCESPLTVTDPNSQVTTTTYDELCRHERTDGPLGAFAETFYVSFGNPTAQYTEVQTPSPNGVGTHWARTYFDGLGRTYVSTSRGASQDIVSGEVTFNARGGVATSALPRFDGDPQYTTSYAYDVRNRPVLTTLPDSNTTSAQYGLKFTLSYNPEGDLSATSRDSTGLVNYFTEYLGVTPIVTATTTDIDGRTETIVDAVGNAWQTQYDSLGRILSLDDPDSGVELREYNDTGEMTAVVNAMSERTEFTYDLLGRLLTKTTLVGTAEEETTTFVYDEARSGYFNVGALTSMLDAAGHRYDDFDELGRPERVERSIDAINYVFTHAYNTAGMPASTTYPDAQTIAWTYDAAGNLQTETGTITTASYDAFGRPTNLSFANGVMTSYSYSATRGWLENINSVKGVTTHQDLTYTRYADGMISGITSAKAMESWSYVYDDLNRLLAATNVDTPSLTQSFTYDDVGNMTYNSQIGSYSYPTPGTGQPHAVQTAGPRSYVYDAVGRMTSRNGQVIQWNGDGKPSSIGSVAFTYGGTGERLKKVSGSQTTRYVGGDYEIAPDGTVTKYLIGGKQVGPSFFVHHSDHLGSIQAVTDATGVEVRRQDHSPFGNQHYANGSHAESKGWIGEREEETELVYLNARYYDPEIGRFASPDPLARLGQGLNRFSYSRNNPISFLDPTGLQDEFSDDILRCNCRFWVSNLPNKRPPTHIVRPGEVVYYSLGGTPVNSWVSDGGEDILQLEEEYAERLADHRRAIDNTVGCSPRFVETCGGSGGGGGPGGGGGGGGSSGGGGSPPTRTYCEKHPDRCGGGAPTGADKPNNPALQEFINQTAQKSSDYSKVAGASAGIGVVVATGGVAVYTAGGAVLNAVAGGGQAFYAYGAQAAAVGSGYVTMGSTYVGRFVTYVQSLGLPQRLESSAVRFGSSLYARAVPIGQRVEVYVGTVESAASAFWNVELPILLSRGANVVYHNIPD